MRQTNNKLASSVRSPDANRITPMPPRNLSNQRQAQAAAHILFRITATKEWLENALAICLHNSRSGIGDSQFEHVIFNPQF